MRLLLWALVGTVTLAVATEGSYAQSRLRIFDVELGAHVATLPANEWVEPSCGTNGGPPSTRLARFEDFAECPVEELTGLREIWFIYDDEWEYIARAYRDPGEIGRFSANRFYGQPIITSLMVDDAGLVQGYRVITDPRAPNEIRVNAYLLHTTFKTLFTDAPWQCVSLPMADREETVSGDFFKEDCVMESAERIVLVEGRHLRKPGQGAFELAPEGYFESSARLDVYAIAAVRDALCCRASVPR